MVYCSHWTPKLVFGCGGHRREIMLFCEIFMKRTAQVHSLNTALEVKIHSSYFHLMNIFCQKGMAFTTDLMYVLQCSLMAILACQFGNISIQKQEKFYIWL